MKITFIGTSSGKATLNRNHSSLLFSSGKYNLLVDAGDGISRALISNGINFNSINGILFTHLHPDHFSGLPALIVQMKMINRTEPLDVYIHDSLRNVVEEFLVRSYLLPERMGFEILYKTFRDNERSIISESFSSGRRASSRRSTCSARSTARRRATGTSGARTSTCPGSARTRRRASPTRAACRFRSPPRPERPGPDATGRRGRVGGPDIASAAARRIARCTP